MKRLATVLILSMATAFCVQAHAGKKADAKKHFKAGLSLLKAEDFDAAAVEFQESLDLFKTKGAMFNLANCYKAMHRYAEALKMLKLLESEFKGSIDEEMAEAIDGLQEEIESITGTIDVKVNRSGAEIFVDGETVAMSPLPRPLLLGPGYREIEVALEGMQTYSKKVKLVARDAITLKVDLVPEGEPLPAVEPEPEAEREREDEEEEEVDLGGVTSGTERSGRSPVLLGLSIAGTAVTVGIGVVAGVYYGRANAAAGDYNNYIGLYNELDPSSTSYNYAAEEDRIFGELVEARDDVEMNNKVAVGMTVGAGVMAAASVVLWVLWAKSDSGEEAPTSVEIAPAPGGMAVNF